MCLGTSRVRTPKTGFSLKNKHTGTTAGSTLGLEHPSLRKLSLSDLSQSSWEKTRVIIMWADGPTEDLRFLISV